MPSQFLTHPIICQNGDGIRCDWPRIPLPSNKDILVHSAELGTRIFALLDIDQPVRGVTTSVGAPFASIGIISRTGARSLDPMAGDLAVTAGWGHPGKGGVTMPGKGKINERDYTADEKEAINEGANLHRLALEQALSCLGQTTLDVYLNPVAFWKNIPVNVWNYTVGGYQVLKKWLSYRELEMLDRPLTPGEVREFRDTARRIAAILLLEPRLDQNYEVVKRGTYSWPI